MKSVIQGDCLQVLPTIPNGSVDLVFADPPFNIGYEYDLYKDTRSKIEYLAWTERWLEHAKRVVKPNGSVFVAIGDEYAAEIKVRLDKIGLSMRNWIIWHYTFGVNCKKKFSRSHVHIFYYVVDPKNFKFFPEEVYVPSARQTTYADKRANPTGKVPDDTWVLRPAEEMKAFSPDSDTWCESRVCGTFKERGPHPCQMPESVMKRIIKSVTEPGDVVLDPFSGSGTTLAVAKLLNRCYIGIELSPEYVIQINERLEKIP